MSEEMIIRHCSPTLAKLKTANLLSCKFDCIYKLRKEICCLNLLLNKKGVSICLLHHTSDRALIYVYRNGMLKSDLNKDETIKFLRAQGYKSDKTEDFISELCQRFSSCNEFPHEIGLFLGYPFEDVKGFIENKGENSILTGCWKVYHNAEDAKRKFSKYKKCTSVYCRKYAEGLSINRLTLVGWEKGFYYEKSSSSFLEWHR